MKKVIAEAFVGEEVDGEMQEKARSGVSPMDMGDGMQFMGWFVCYKYIAEEEEA